MSSGGKGSRRISGQGYAKNFEKIQWGELEAAATDDCPACVADIEYEKQMELAQEIVSAAEAAFDKFINDEVDES